MGSEFFFALFAKVTLTPFNGLRSTFVSILRKSTLPETVATPWMHAGGGPAAAYFYMDASYLPRFFCVLPNR